MNAGGGPEEPRRPDDQWRQDRRPDGAREGGGTSTPGGRAYETGDRPQTRPGAWAHGQGSYGQDSYGPRLSAYDPRQQGAAGQPPYRGPGAGQPPYGRTPYQQAAYGWQGHGGHGGDGPPARGPATPSDTLWQTPVTTWDVPGPPAGGGGGGRRLRGSRRTLLATLMVLALVVVVTGGGAGAYLLLSGDGTGTALALHNRATRIGEDAFALGAPAGGDGVSEPLNDVAAVGDTVVAVGNAQDGNVGSGLFLFSTDGGARWRLADVKAKDGGQPPPWEFPDYVVGAKGAWLALSSTGHASAVWTSADGRTWTHLGDAAAKAFAPRDHIRDLARRPSGYVAAGYTTRGGGDAPVIWTSKTGRAWKRIGPKRLRLPHHLRVDEIQQVVARGRVILAKGVSHKSGKPALLRSRDGGRTWKRAAMPKVKGSFDPVGILASSGSRFVAVVDGVAKKRFTSVSVVMSSADGRHWKRVGTIHLRRGKKNVTSEAVAANRHRLAVLAAVGSHTYAVFTSKGGGRWSRPVRVGSSDKLRLMGLSATGGSVVAVGSTQGADTDPVAVRVKGGHAKPIDLSKVSGVPRARHVLNAVATGGRSSVAVGGAGGGAAIWTSARGRSWRRVKSPSGALAAPGGSRSRELLDVVHGKDGWVAVGVSDSSSGDEIPLVVTSRGGVRWRSVGGRSAFAAHAGGKKHRPTRLVPRAVTYGPSGYVIAGYESRRPGTFSGVAWHSRDLGSWRRGTGTGAHDLSATSGVSRRMLDVTGGSFGYAAAGLTRRGADSRPAVWTSKGGDRWDLRRVKVPGPGDSGSLRRIASRGDTIAALGMATVTGKPHDPRDDRAFPFGAVSHDGGKTWKTRRLPTVRGGAYVTDLTAAQGAFVAVGVAGEAGRGDVVVWYSGDARSWRTVAPKGEGLSGPGEQQLGGIAARGAKIVGVGYSADYREDLPVLWQARIVS